MSQSPHFSAPQRSRRDFLKTTGAMASAAVLGPLAIARGAHAAGSDVIKIGLVGCGGRGCGAAGNAMNAGPDVRLVAMADVFADKVQSGRKLLKQQKPDQVAVDDEHCFVGFDAYQKVIASEVDVVLIAAASKFHPDYLAAAVKAGKHVFVEKPHAVDPPGVRKVAAACEEARRKGLSVVSGLCWRYHYGVRETVKRVLDGAIGPVVAIQETYMRAPYQLFARPEGLGEMEYQFRNWYHFRWLSGDDILQSLVHSMDKAAWVMRDEPPVAAFGVGGRAASFEPIYGDVFDHNALVYEYANGARMVAFGRAQNGCYDEVSDHVLGATGRADLLKFRIEGATKWRYDGPDCNMYDVEHKELFESIRAGKPINNGAYMVNSTMLGVLGEMVCYTGRRVTWDEAMKAQYTLGPDQCDFQTDPPVKPGKDGLYPVPIPGMTKLA